ICESVRRETGDGRRVECSHVSPLTSHGVPKSFGSNRSPTLPLARSTEVPRSRNVASVPTGDLACTVLFLNHVKYSILARTAPGLTRQLHGWAFTRPALTTTPRGSCVTVVTSGAKTATSEELASITWLIRPLGDCSVMLPCTSTPSGAFPG